MRARAQLLLDPDNLLAAGACALGLQLSPQQIQAFRLYREEIARWSERTNLTALRTAEEIVREGFLDSLACLRLAPVEASRTLDIGSGAGFPAIPIRLARPSLRLTLVEAARKKATFLRHIVRCLDLQDVRILCCRAEALAVDPDERGVYDLALARAVAPLHEQVRLAAPFLRPGGIFLAQVGQGSILQRAGLGHRVEGFEVAAEYALPPLLGRPDRRVLGLRRLQA